MKQLAKNLDYQVSSPERAEREKQDKFERILSQREVETAQVIDQKLSMERNKRS